MSATIHSSIRDLANKAFSKEDKRAFAVAVALELINSKVGNTPDKTVALKEEMDRLSVYADQIQEALKVK